MRPRYWSCRTGTECYVHTTAALADCGLAAPLPCAAGTWSNATGRAEPCTELCAPGHYCGEGSTGATGTPNPEITKIGYSYGGLSAWMQITQNALITSMSTTADYELRFELQFEGVVSGTSNILHFTTLSGSSSSAAYANIEE